MYKKQKVQEVCEICCEETGITIECKNKECKYKQCQKCVTRYLIYQKRIEGFCARCTTIWDYGYLCRILPQSYMQREYKEKIKEILHDIEKGKYVEVMQIVEERKEKRKHYEEMLERKRKESQQKDEERDRMILEFEKEFGKKYDDYNWKKLEKEKRSDESKSLEEKRAYKKIDKIKKEILRIQRDIQKIRIQYNEGQKEKKEEIKIKKIKYIIQCPERECRGYVNEIGFCGVCDTRACEECHERKEEGHKCKEDDKETVKIKKKETNQCPNCRTNIQKIDGCNHFFCTQCKASFDWETLQPIQKNTSPHYYEYLRKNEQQENEITENQRYFLQGTPQQNPYGMQIVLRMINRIKVESDKELLQEEIRQIDHVTTEIEYFERKINYKNKYDISVKYIEKEIEKEEYKERLYSRWINEEKYKDFKQILEAYRIEGTRIFNNAQKSIQESKEEDMLKNMMKLDILMKIVIKKYQQKQKQHKSYIEINLLRLKDKNLSFQIKK